VASIANDDGKACPAAAGTASNPASACIPTSWATAPHLLLRERSTRGRTSRSTPALNWAAAPGVHAREQSSFTEHGDCARAASTQRYVRSTWPRRRQDHPLREAMTHASHQAAARLAHVETWVFDLDNSLYPHHVNLCSR